MARIRTIKPEFPQSESMGRVSREARLLFVLLWTIADDSGRARAASRLLASLLYPYDDDASGLIDGWLDELETEGCISRYEADGSHYLQIAKWAEHQKIDRPTDSKLPAPDDGSTIIASDRAPSPPPREPSPQPRDDSRALAPRARAPDLDLDRGPRTVDHGPGTVERGPGTVERGPEPTPAIAGAAAVATAAAAKAARPAGSSNGVATHDAATATRPAELPNGATPGPADGGRKRAGGLGPGGTLLREVCRLTPPIAVRERIEEVCARYGEECLREVATEWVSRGHRPHNWSGILDVVEHGWQRQNGNGRRHLPPDEAAAVERMVAEGMEAATERIAAGPDRAVLLWHEVLAVLEERVLPTTHRQWFVPLVPVSLADGVLSVRPPTPAVRDLVRSRGLPLVTEAMADVAPGVQFELAEMATARAGGEDRAVLAHTTVATHGGRLGERP